MINNKLEYAVSLLRLTLKDTTTDTDWTDNQVLAIMSIWKAVNEDNDMRAIVRLHREISQQLRTIIKEHSKLYQQAMSYSDGLDWSISVLHDTLEGEPTEISISTTEGTVTTEAKLRHTKPRRPNEKNYLS